MRFNFLTAGWLYVVAILAVLLTCCVLLQPRKVPAFVSLADDNPPAAPAGARSR